MPSGDHRRRCIRNGASGGWLLAAIVAGRQRHEWSVISLQSLQVHRWLLALPSPGGLFSFLSQMWRICSLVWSTSSMQSYHQYSADSKQYSVIIVADMDKKSKKVIHPLSLSHTHTHTQTQTTQSPLLQSRPQSWTRFHFFILCRTTSGTVCWSVALWQEMIKLANIPSPGHQRYHLFDDPLRLFFSSGIQIHFGFILARGKLSVKWGWPRDGAVRACFLQRSPIDLWWSYWNRFDRLTKCLWKPDYKLLFGDMANIVTRFISSVFSVEGGKVVPIHILMEGNGHTDKGINW